MICFRWHVDLLRFYLYIQHEECRRKKPRNFQVQFGSFEEPLLLGIFTVLLLLTQLHTTYYIHNYMYVCMCICILHAMVVFLFGVERILQKQIKPIKQHSFEICRGIHWLVLLLIRSFVCLFAYLCVHS